MRSSTDWQNSRWGAESRDKSPHLIRDPLMSDPFQSKTPASKFSSLRWHGADVLFDWTLLPLLDFPLELCMPALSQEPCKSIQVTLVALWEINVQLRVGKSVCQHAQGFVHRNRYTAFSRTRSSNSLISQKGFDVRLCKHGESDKLVCMVVF
ncbi:hypothetical protein BC830DRAFT_1123001 [Chytriomyces sp. MP71]|nr:hypothetical protein BC830DRAFT_1123001 [Chytriomyces sp. MP71]